MICKMEFLSDTNQKKIIHLVQSRTETFQESIESYRRTFLGIKNNIFEIDRCSCGNEEKCVYRNKCSIISEIIKTVKDIDINYFFDLISDSYTLWINNV